MSKSKLILDHPICSGLVQIVLDRSKIACQFEKVQKRIFTPEFYHFESCPQQFGFAHLYSLSNVKYQFYNWFVLGGKATSIETIYYMVEHFRLFPIYNKVALLDRPAKWNEANTNICEK